LKKIFFLLLLAFKAIVSSQQCNSIYIKNLGGINYLYAEEKYIHMRSDPIGYYLGAAVGYRFYDLFDYEFEFAFRNHPKAKVSIPDSILSPFKKGSRYALSYMFNIFYPINNTSAVQPYLGFGIGYTQVRGELKGSDNHSSHDVYTYPLEPLSNFASQIILGVCTPVSLHVEASLEGRYIHEIYSNYEFKFLKTHNISLGLCLKHYF
jgi:opacity protein-like surface antigen